MGETREWKERKMNESVKEGRENLGAWKGGEMERKMQMQMEQTGEAGRHGRMIEGEAKRARNLGRGKEER